MASNPEFVQYIAEQLHDAGRITYRKMFGEYGMYCGGKIFALICENQLFATAAAERASVLESMVLDELLGLDLSRWVHTKVKALQTHLTNLQQDTAEKAIYRIVHFMGYGDYLKQHEVNQRLISILESLASQVQKPEELLKRLDELCNIVKNGSTDPQSPVYPVYHPFQQGPRIRAGHSGGCHRRYPSAKWC